MPNDSQLAINSDNNVLYIYDEENEIYQEIKTLTAAGPFTVGGLLEVNGGAVFNEDSADVDFRIESDVNQSAFFLQGSDGFVGLGSDSPQLNLHIEGVDPGIVFIDTSATVGKKGFRLITDNNRMTIQRASDAGAFEANYVNIDQDTGKVGIGTILQDKMLHVASAIVEEGRVIAEETGVTGSNYPGYELRNETVFKGGIFYQESTDNVEIWNDTQRAIIIHTNGDVGVGGVPTALLHIQGPDAILKIEDTTATGQPKLAFIDEGGTERAFIQVGFTGTQQDTLTLRNPSSEIHFKTQAATTTDMIVKNGNVGIGTTTPARRAHFVTSAIAQTNIDMTSMLILEDNDHTRLNIRTPNNKQGAISFSDPDTPWRGLISYDHSADDLSFWTATTRRLTIDSSGDIGMGTTGPVSPLHLDATGTAFNAITGLAIFQDNGDRQIVIGGLGMFRRDTNANADLRMNYLGYNGGTTQFRDFDIYDGKSTKIASFDGSAGAFNPGADNANDMGTTGSLRWKDVYTINAVTVESDMRAKGYSLSLDHQQAISLITKLRPIEYVRNDDPMGTTRWGFPAQEVVTTLDEIGLNPNRVSFLNYDLASDSYGLRNEELIPPIVAVVSNHEERIVALEQKSIAA